jgi:hypothetical protein
MESDLLTQRDRHVPLPKKVFDNPTVAIRDNDLEVGIRRLAKLVGKSRTFKLLALRNRNPSKQARARAKARGAESRRRMDMKKGKR